MFGRVAFDGRIAPYGANSTYQRNAPISWPPILLVSCWIPFPMRLCGSAALRRDLSLSRIVVVVWYKVRLDSNRTFARNFNTFER